jgi:hypothetical protein
MGKFAMLIHGSCHCRNIAFVLDWKSQPDEIRARACTCSFCVKHGGVWTSCVPGTLAVTVRDPSSVAEYAFETRTAQFQVCAVCGVVPLVTSRIDGRLYAVVNVNAFDDVDAALLKRLPLTVDAEDEATRLARRAKNWIGDVIYRQAGR